MKVKELLHGVWVGAPMQLKNMFDYKTTARLNRSNKVSAQTVFIKDAYGKTIGARTIYQKK